MAKSISGGLGTVNLSVQELRLLGGTFTTLDTTTLTVLGTATLGSLTISGTFTIDQLTANTIETQNLTATDTISIKAINNTTDTTDNKIAFIHSGSDTGILNTSTNLYYKPSTDELRAGRFIGNVTGNLTGNVEGNLVGNVSGATNITSTNITSTGNMSITALNNTTASVNNRILFINGNSSETGVVVSRGNFNYNTSTETLNCGTFNGTLNGSVANAVTIGTQDITVSGTTTINSKDVTATTQLCRILFLDGSSDVGTNYDIVRATPLYYIPSSSTLVTNNIRGQVQLISPQLTLLGSALSSTNASIGLYDDGTAVRNRYQHVGGHVFTNNSNNLLSTNTIQTRIYNELQCDDDVTITGTLTAGTLNIGTQSATNFSVTNNLTVGGDTTLSNVPIASGSTGLNMLLVNSNNTIQQSNFITYVPQNGTLITPNVSLTGALLSSLITTTGNGTIGGNLGVTGNGSIGGDLTVTGSIVGDLGVTGNGTMVAIWG